MEVKLPPDTIFVCVCVYIWKSVSTKITEFRDTQANSSSTQFGLIPLGNGRGSSIPALHWIQFSSLRMDLTLTISGTECELLRNGNDPKLSSILWNGILDLSVTEATEHYSAFALFTCRIASLRKRGREACVRRNTAETSPGMGGCAY